MVARGKFGDSNCQALDFTAYRGACPQSPIQGYNAVGIRMNVSTGVFYDGDDDNTFNPIHR